jgi:hypothetical protein
MRYGFEEIGFLRFVFAIGCCAGIVFCLIRYKVSGGVILGFPLPIVVMEIENGNAISFTSPLTIFFGLLDFGFGFAVVLVCARLYARNSSLKL